jgi:hypothetical protein
MSICLAFPGFEFNVEKKHIANCKVITNMIEDIGIESIGAIPISIGCGCDLTRDEVTQYFELCQRFRSDITLHDDWFAVFSGFDSDFVKKLILMANWLDDEEMLNAFAEAFAKFHIKNL